MAKQLMFSDEAHRRLKLGIDTLATAVATTLGPKGRNVLTNPLAPQPSPTTA